MWKPVQFSAKPLDLHEVGTQAQGMQSLTFSLITISVPLVLTGQHKVCFVSHRQSVIIPNDKTTSNLVIAINCPAHSMPHSRCFVSNWSVPFAWLIWLPHFSPSLLWQLLWCYRCWVSLIMPLIGLEMFSCKFCVFFEEAEEGKVAKPRWAIDVFHLLEKDKRSLSF